MIPIAATAERAWVWIDRVMGAFKLGDTALKRAVGSGLKDADFRGIVGLVEIEGASSVGMTELGWELLEPISI